MERTCLKCGHVNPHAAVEPDALEECPRCGAIYARVEASRERANAVRKPGAPAKKQAGGPPWAWFTIALVIVAGVISWRANRPDAPKFPARSPPPLAAAPSVIATKPAAPAPTARVECAIDDATCLGERALGAASGPCSRAVEAQLRYRSEWRDAWYEEKFDRVGWYVPIDSIIFHGNKLEAQNGFGAWQKVNYFCVWSLSDGRVIKAGINE